MIVFWFFVIVLAICTEIIACVFIDRAIKRQLHYISEMLQEIKESLAKMGGK